MALYLKYRPQLIAQLDIASAREDLFGLLRSRHLPHALLFTGVRGTGKTSSARILAKAVNCQHKLNASKDDTHSGQAALEPCNSCDLCKAITDGSCLDVIEIDAASHRGIDDIRDLREKVKLAPAQATYKVYIIDEVHMLTTEAFNALLKTLEEPPKHVLFILCTTEVHKLPETILSRCHTISFKKATMSEIAQSLKRVADGEKLEISEEALQEVAKMAEGSFRDGTKFLEELTWRTGPIDVTAVREAMKSHGRDLHDLLVLLRDRNSHQVVTWLEEAAATGRDMKVMTRQLVVALHDELLQMMGDAGTARVFGLPDKVGLIKLIDAVDGTWSRQEFTHIAQLPLELALLEWIDAQSVGRVSQPVSSGGAKTVVRTESQAQRVAPQPTVAKQTAPVEVQPVQPHVPIEATTSQVSTTVTEVKAVIQDGTVDVTVIANNWENVMAEVKPRNFSVEALLRAAKPMLVDGNDLILEVLYQFHYDQLQQEKSRQVVEQVLAEMFGMPLQLRCQLVEKQPGATRKLNVIAEDMMEPVMRTKSAGSANQNTPAANGGGGGNGQGFRRRQAAPPPVATEEDEALVQFASEIFGK